MENANGVLPGWHTDCYQATAGPVMLALIPQGISVPLVIISIFLMMVKPAALVVPALLYAIAFVGTMWEPYWYNMLLEYLGYGSTYEA